MGSNDRLREYPIVTEQGFPFGLRCAVCGLDIGAGGPYSEVAEGMAGGGIGHPTPKPIPLMEALIEYAPRGVITDPFAGSGATIIAARNLGRKVIGVEIEEAYCELIASRLGQQAFDFAGLT